VVAGPGPARGEAGDHGRGGLFAPLSDAKEAVSCRGALIRPAPRGVLKPRGI
jgi:hypothetical protein